jgi:hypothetical protein
MQLQTESPFVAVPSCTPSRGWIRLILFVLAAIGAQIGNAQNLIFVTNGGSPSASTCTLAQAIGLANYANGVFDPAGIGSATTSFGGCQTIPPPFPVPPPGAYTLYIDFAPAQITLTTIDNYWYGPNALPPIACNIAIVPLTGTLQLIASHSGDPAPATANAFRFFYISGGLEFGPGALTLVNTVLQGGYAKGGDAGDGGGGAGMGGAIFNQGTLVLTNVSLLGNSARGGSAGAGNVTGGGGMGQDATTEAGGGFGPSPYWPAPSGFGGAGGTGFFAGGGGGGFRTGDAGASASSPQTNGGAGGGHGSLGGTGGTSGAYQGGVAGDGGGGGGGNHENTVPAGGAFGVGGQPGTGGAGGGGIGGGGGFAELGGGGGGFGAGGGAVYVFVAGDPCASPGSGGFGGGGGGSKCTAAAGNPAGPGGFGAGSAIFSSAHGSGGGGAGMGGAIFNHRGSVSLLNVTATGNAAIGGTSVCATCNGSGLGAVLFNLNGNVSIDFSTFAGNFLSGNNGRAGSFGPEDGSVYSIAYGDKIEDGTQSSASLVIHNSIVHGTHADGGDGNDILVNVVDGKQANSSSVAYKGKNFVQRSANVGSVTQTGVSPMQADPLLGAVSLYGSSLLPVLPIGSNSPAYDTASSCLEADNATTLTIDARGAARPYGAQCDVGAYEFDGDYIFASNNEPTL